MARKIIWSIRAQDDRKQIFKYWNKRNKSKVYSRKLNSLYKAAAEFIAINPRTGRKSTKVGVRIKFVSHYALIYEYNSELLIIHTIFDSRQSPDKLDSLLSDR